MIRLRTRLIAVFILATALPLGLTLWTTVRLLESSLDLAPMTELAQVTQSLEETGKELYQQARETLRRDATENRVPGRTLSPNEVEVLLSHGDIGNFTELFERAGTQGDRLDYYVRRDNHIVVYSRPLGLSLQRLTDQIADAHRALETSRERDIRGAFRGTLYGIAATLWLAALATLIFLAARITRPVRRLTQGLGRVAAGDLSARVEINLDKNYLAKTDEVEEAMVAFNTMASQLQQSREHLIQVTRLASWQALARKMAHEVKNSLTPIRLTMEEIVSRQEALFEHGTAPASERAFLEQAAQIISDEVNTLERRVRAFSEFAAEPPVSPDAVDLNSLVEERVAFLRAAHPEVVYQLELSSQRPTATADPDLVKGILTNLLENAAHAAGTGGIVVTRTRLDHENVQVEVFDSGPGLSLQARSTLFEPSISFKKGGMGLGLSIARRSAVLCGGDLVTFDGELGGAGFRLLLPMVAS